ncbi:hypothetical protein FisN_15Lu017 [Fistulifera solaris]|uniref:Uncharacterized protein n=1 Tax=Fistulifera solaris TaxID=1519565 RepID=A0A1Z5KHP9_FISSO|nr:hypothetical protein FisN_15Lu017 [Fistulifera solaris]|eukprot:GAX25645.1 hypothetical protein FisN_15Lu017 [Fistulifera solaris]
MRSFFCCSLIALPAVLLSTVSHAFQIDTLQEGQGRNVVVDLQNTPFAKYWENITSLEKFSGEKTHLKVEGYTFSGRMTVYHYLIHSIDLGDLWGDPFVREYHWLWSYAAQLDWQHRSKRLQTLGDDSDTNDEISQESWWAYMNFGFSVAILLGWKQTRPDITTELDIYSQFLTDNDKAMQKCIQGWEALFREGYSDFIDAYNSQANIMEARYILQHHVWKVHTSVIEYCQSEGTIYSTLLDKLPSPERQFGEGWARLVHVLAAACFPTDLVTLKQDGGGFLPLQRLEPETWETMPRSNFYDACRYRTVLATHDLVLMKPSQINAMIGFWTRIARSHSLSRMLPRVIVDLYHGSFLTKFQKLGQLMFWFFRPGERIAIVLAVLLPWMFKLLH